MCVLSSSSFCFLSPSPSSLFTNQEPLRIQFFISIYANTDIEPGRKKAAATVFVDNVIVVVVDIVVVVVIVVVVDVTSSVDDTSDIQRPVKRIEEIGGLCGSASVGMITSFTCPVPSRGTGSGTIRDGFLLRDF